MIEALRSARSARGYTLLFGLVSLIAVVAVVLLSGQAGAQRDKVRAEFDKPEYRTATIVDQENSGLIGWDASRQVGGLTSVERAWALGSAFDVFNGSLPDRGRAAAQAVGMDSWALLPVSLSAGRWPHGSDEAILPAGSDSTLGLDGRGGWVEDQSGRTWSVVGSYRADYAGAPTAVLVSARAGMTPRTLSLTVRQPSQVEAAVESARSFTAATSAAQLAVQTAGNAPELDQAVSGAVSRSLSAIVTTVMTASLGILAFLAVLMVYARRQEFGRRRALGASRELVISLILLQTGLVVAAATLVGVWLGWLAARWWLDYDVPVGFLTGVAVTAICGAALAQLPSALAAGFRDPVRVLRSP